MEPLISVKIPTYNCAEYLIQTIESILNQKDFNLDLLDIEVVDDCSTIDNPKKIVEDYGQGRVKFYQQTKNVGAVSNFNTCINRSDCKYIHILHGDDYIENQFYQKIYNALITLPLPNLVVTRISYVDDNNLKLGESPLFTNSINIKTFIRETPFQFAGILIKADLIKKLKGFDNQLIHLNDRDMWLRLFLYGPNDIIYINDILANYRIFNGNDTSKLIKTGKNITDLFRYYKKNMDVLKINKYDTYNLMYYFYKKQTRSLKNWKHKYLNFIELLKCIGIINYFKCVITNLVIYNKIKNGFINNCLLL